MSGIDRTAVRVAPERPWRAVTAAIAGARAGAGRIVVVEGAAGSGKTHLLDRAAAEAAAGRHDEARTLHADARATYDEAGALRSASRASARLGAHGLHLGVRGPRSAGRGPGGHTNPEIAGRLFVSPRTVETHVSHILGKLGATSRRELVTGAA